MIHSTLRALAFAAALWASNTAAAQDQIPPQQWDIWEVMLSIAPAYEAMLACDRPRTAELIRNTVAQISMSIVQTDEDLRIIEDMWRQARTEAYFNFLETLQDLARDPSGEFCNQMELLIVQRLRVGV